MMTFTITISLVVASLVAGTAVAGDYETTKKFKQQSACESRQRR